MTHGDSFQQIAALRADLQRVDAFAREVAELALQMRREFDDYVRAGASPEGHSEPELLREPDKWPEPLNMAEPDMGPEV